MTDFNVNIVGCGSATPSLRHLPSAQVVNHQGRLFMVDCGEGAQLQLRRMRLKFSALRHFFISHLHGDHILGLPGLLSTLSLHDVTGEMHFYTFPEGIAWLKEFLRISFHQSTLDVVFHPLEPVHQVVYSDDHLTVEAFPLRHRVPCVGYKFVEKPKPRKIRGDMMEFFNVPVYQRPAIKMGADFVKPDGEIVLNSRLTLDPDPSRSYAYCSDTIMHPSVIEAVRGVDTLYHEATYADDKAASAKERGHSTARQAGIVAREAQVGKLIIGHFSKSYTDESLHLAQARQEFPNVVAANEGMCIPV